MKSTKSLTIRGARTISFSLTGNQSNVCVTGNENFREKRNNWDPD